MDRVQVLVVEDEGLVAADIQSILEGLGYDVPFVASSGEEAVAKAKETCPELVLMDIVLKGDMDGVEAATQIRAHLDIPVVYLTAYADKETLARAKVTEPFGYVVKPFEERDLHSVIEMALYKHRTEKELRHSEEYFRALIENAADMVAILDSDGTVRYVSPSSARVTGYDPGDLIGTNAVDFVHPGDVSKVLQAIVGAIEGRSQVQSAEFRWLHKDGTYRFLEAAGCSRLEDPVIEGIVVNCRDVTERRAAQEQLERLFIELAEAISRAVCCHEPYRTGHDRLVAELASYVGEKMGLDKDRVRGLYVGGLLYNIGEISSPFSLVRDSAGSLSVEGRGALYEDHTRRGHEILKDVEFPWPVADMALHHHERLDGSGFPHGLTGDALSLEVRILAACDVLKEMDFLGSRSGNGSREEVKEELRTGSGMKYDADVVDVVLDMIQSGKLDLVAAELKEGGWV